MTRTKFFGFLFPLAIAGGLALGFAPALADPPPHSHGGGAISDGDPPWAVSLFDLEVDGSVREDPCLGTPVQNKDTLATDFERGCTIFMTSGGIDIGDAGLSLFRMEVRERKNGQPKALLAFTTNPNFLIGEIAEVWSTDWITVEITDNSDGSITLIISPSDIIAGALTKERQPGKGTMTDQDVTFLEIVYEPIN